MTPYRSAVLAHRAGCLAVVFGMMAFITCGGEAQAQGTGGVLITPYYVYYAYQHVVVDVETGLAWLDRKSTRLNSSHRL